MRNKYNIYIYDDLPAAVYALMDCISQCAEQIGCKVDFYCASDYKQAENLFNSSQHTCDVFFLDIELDNGISGIELADRLIDRFPDLKVVFITGYTDKYSQAIFTQSRRLRPYGYITKPFNIDVVKRVFELVICEDKIGDEPTVELSRSRRQIKFRCSDIIYIESYRRKLIFHFRSSAPEEVYGKISEISASLPENFLQCHRCYIVNADYIHSINKLQNTIELNNGEMIFLGNTKKDSFMQAYFRHKGGLSSVR